jgi:hypothetical protein
MIEKKDRQPNGQQRKGSSKAIKRRRADKQMDKRARGHQSPYRGQETQWSLYNSYNNTSAEIPNKQKLTCHMTLLPEVWLEEEAIFKIDRSLCSNTINTKK